MSLPIIVIGAGGHAAVVADALLAAGERLLGFVDADTSRRGCTLCGLPVLGGDEVLDSHAPATLVLANGIGGVGRAEAEPARRSIQQRLAARGWQFAGVRHPSAIVSPFAHIGPDAQLLAACVVQAGAEVGEGSIVNTAAVVEHDAVTGVKAQENSVVVEYKKRDTEAVLSIEADYCLIAIGRRPYTDNLGLENVGVKKDERGRIDVDGHLQTNVAGIYAIGDVVKGAMLAHKAEEEGVFVAESIVGQKPHINYLLIPGVVYTWPEVAAVGYTEEQLKENGMPYKVGKFPFKALGRARASMDTEGMVKVLAHKDTDEILGVHMVGPRTADMIAEAVALMEFRASAEDASRMSHAHPTYTEAFKEACLAATDNRALHV